MLSQSPNVLWSVRRGHIVGHVKNVNDDASNPTTRIYSLPIAQPFHNDTVSTTPKQFCSSCMSTHHTHNKSLYRARSYTVKERVKAFSCMLSCSASRMICKHDSILCMMQCLRLDVRFNRPKLLKFCQLAYRQNFHSEFMQELEVNLNFLVCVKFA